MSRRRANILNLCLKQWSSEATHWLFERACALGRHASAALHPTAGRRGWRRHAHRAHRDASQRRNAMTIHACAVVMCVGHTAAVCVSSQNGRRQGVSQPFFCSLVFHAFCCLLVSGFETCDFMPLQLLHSNRSIKNQKYSALMFSCVLWIEPGKRDTGAVTCVLFLSSIYYN